MREKGDAGSLLIKRMMSSVIFLSQNHVGISTFRSGPVIATCVTYIDPKSRLLDFFNCVKIGASEAIGYNLLLLICQISYGLFHLATLDLILLPKFVYIYI